MTQEQTAKQLQAKLREYEAWHDRLEKKPQNITLGRRRWLRCEIAKLERELHQVLIFIQERDYYRKHNAF